MTARHAANATASRTPRTGRTAAQQTGQSSAAGSSVASSSTAPRGGTGNGPEVTFPVPIDSTVAAKFDSVLEDCRNIVSNINTSIAHTTDAAVALKEVEDQEEVEKLDAAVQDCVGLSAAVNDMEKFVTDIKRKLLRGEKINDLVNSFDLAEAEFERTWKKKSGMEKYNSNAEYIEFRSKIWEAEHGDIPMPPLPTAGGDSDEDLVVGTQKVSLSCPLTTKLFEDPVTSSVCNHSFSKAAIVGYIRSHRGQVACPIPGCSAHLKVEHLKPDAQLALKVQRHQRRLEDERLEEQDEYAMVE